MLMQGVHALESVFGMVCAMSFWQSQSIYIYKLINARGLSHSLTLFSFFFFLDSVFLSCMIIFGKLFFPQFYLRFFEIILLVFSRKIRTERFFFLIHIKMRNYILEKNKQLLIHSTIS